MERSSELDLNSEPIIRTEAVTQLYNAGKPDEMLALDGVSLELYGGQITVLKGPSGSGKTTLLSLIGCMARPYSGNVFVRGENVAKLTERFLTEIRRKHFGFIFQQFQLLRDISVLENVLLPLYPQDDSLGEIRNYGLELLDKFELLDKKADKVKNLSGGEQQRVAIARALINGPEIIFADEPTAHLDRKLSEDFVEIIKGLAAEGKTIIMATHDPLLYEASFVGKVVEMQNGRIKGQIA